MPASSRPLSAGKGEEQQEGCGDRQTLPPRPPAVPQPRFDTLAQFRRIGAKVRERGERATMVQGPGPWAAGRLLDLFQMFTPLRVAFEAVPADVGHRSRPQIMISPPVTGTTAPVI